MSLFSKILYSVHPVYLFPSFSTVQHVPGFSWNIPNFRNIPNLYSIPFLNTIVVQNMEVLRNLVDNSCAQMSGNT